MTTRIITTQGVGSKIKHDLMVAKLAQSFASTHSHTSAILLPMLVYNLLYVSYRRIFFTNYIFDFVGWCHPNFTQHHYGFSIPNNFVNSVRTKLEY